MKYDEAFTQARIADLRRLLDIAEQLGSGIDAARLPPDSAYDGWAPTYDDPENGLFAIEEHHVRPILDTLPVGVTVDRARGTERHAGYLAALGHEVRGFDTSPRMLELTTSAPEWPETPSPTCICPR